MIRLTKTLLTDHSRLTSNI